MLGASEPGGQAGATLGVGATRVAPPPARGPTVATLYIRLSYVVVPQEACVKGTGDLYEIFRLFFALFKRVS